MAKTKGTAAKAAAVKKSAAKVKPAKPAPAGKTAPKPKPPKSTRVTTPIAVPIVVAPAPPPQRDELPAPRDIGRLLRYGERFGANKIDTRMWAPTTLPVPSGALSLCDPAQPKSWRVLDRPSGAGQFRIMLSVAKSDSGAESLAALIVHTGRPPIARWTVAHARGQKKPKLDAELPTVPIASGWLAIVDAGAGSPGAIATPPPPDKAATFQPIEIPLTDGRRALAIPCPAGDYTAYWAVDAADKPICLVIDFDAFTQKEWKAKPA